MNAFPLLQLGFKQPKLQHSWNLHLASLTFGKNFAMSLPVAFSKFLIDVEHIFCSPVLYMHCPANEWLLHNFGLR